MSIQSRLRGQVVRALLKVVTGLVVGSNGTQITQLRVFTPTLTPASVAAASVAEQTFAVSGLTTSDKVFVEPPAETNTDIMLVSARVSAADTLALRFYNKNGTTAQTPASGTYKVVAIRS